MATEVIKTIKSTGGDYTSLEAFLSGEARDLVAADEVAVAEVYISFDSVAMDTTSQAWVTDDTRKIIIRNAPGVFHNGHMNQGIKLVTRSTSYFLVLQSGHHMLIEGVELTGYSSASRFVYEPGASLEVKKCLIHDINRPFSASSGLKLLENCAIWQVGDYVAYGSDITKVVNCSIYADGVGAYNGQIILRDCVCYNTVIYNTTTGGYDNFYSCTGDYNASNDTSAPGTNVIDNITLSEIGWTSVVAGSEDLHIGSASLLIDAGIGHNFNSDIPITDIAGNERGLDVCDIGAFEYVSGGVTEFSLDMAWKIKNEASKNISSKILNEKNKSSDWKILNEQSKDMSWLIFNQVEKSSVWKVLNLSQKILDYKILDETSKDISFKIQNESSKNIEYKILTEAQKEIAWRILTSGVLSLDISWKILNESEKEISSKIFNESTKDISWKILGISETSVNLAWKILNEVEQIVEWKIKDENSSDLAWKILNELSLDTSFKIFEIKSHDLAYKIFNEIEKDISWKIISGVETKTIDFTATKRILDFNSEQKIYAFNSKTRTLIFYQKERK
jgi:hypothetical protein